MEIEHISDDVIVVWTIAAQPVSQPALSVAMSWNETNIQVDLRARDVTIEELRATIEARDEELRARDEALRARDVTIEELRARAGRRSARPRLWCIVDRRNT